MGNVSGLGLQEEEEVAVFLCFVIIGEEALLKISRIFQMACDFILLILLLARPWSSKPTKRTIPLREPSDSE